MKTFTGEKRHLFTATQWTRHHWVSILISYINNFTNSLAPNTVCFKGMLNEYLLLLIKKISAHQKDEKILS